MITDARCLTRDRDWARFDGNPYAAAVRGGALEDLETRRHIDPGRSVPVVGAPAGRRSRRRM